MEFKDWAQVFHRVQELDNITKELLKDAHLHKNASVDIQNQGAYMRQFTRGAFSTIEAVMFATKQLIKEILIQSGDENSEYMPLLDESTVVLSEAGKKIDKENDANYHS
ncbi:hypothetical protein EON83_00770 [bacterium]|nr:MAG: hypothetical protein EON83_00770 [bacterium]